MNKTIHDCALYVRERLAYNNVPFYEKTANTGTVYFIVSGIKIRIANHAGITDSYHYVVRVDCKKPMPVRGCKVITPENLDKTITEIIDIYRSMKKSRDQLKKILESETYTKSELKQIDYDWLIKNHVYQCGKMPSKEHIILRLIEAKRDGRVLRVSGKR